MLKKTIWLLSLIGVLGLVNCGGGGSKEAKELLQKILQLVGIPHSIVVNVCQDTNKNGFCGEGELFTKVTINQGDSVDNIFEKISLTADGRYFLETYDPELPILLELQDATKVNYDGGKFHLAFNGFRTKKDDNETKELSILASMVDANHLTNQDVKSIRNLNTKSTQDKFYASLLSALEENVNTLRGVDINPQNTMSANIKLMADKLIADGLRTTLADTLNACNTDEACVDKILQGLSTNLLISDVEAQEIKKEQSGVNPNNSNANKIDLREYMPLSSMEKNFIFYNKVDGQEETTSSMSSSYEVEGNIIKETILLNSTRYLVSTKTINTDTIATKLYTIGGNDSSIKHEFTYDRYASLANTLYTFPLDDTEEANGIKTVSSGDQTCQLENKIENFNQRGYAYSGGLIVVKCTQKQKQTITSGSLTSKSELDLTYTEYLNKNIDLVARIMDSCTKNDQGSEVCSHSELYYIQ